MSQCTGKVCLPIAGCTFQNDMMPVFNVLAGSKTENLCLVQFTVFVILNSFYGGIWC